MNSPEPTNPNGINHMNVREFQEFGFLQEANRLFFHPLGLALSVNVDDDGKALSFARVWDYRSDPEGIIYGPGMIDPEKTARVNELRHEKAEVRRSLFGSIVQPLPQKENAGD